MRVPCPTCGRLGRLPKVYPDGAVISYCGINGEHVPHEICQSCAGTGWVNDERAPIRSDAAVADDATADLMRRIRGA